MLTTSSERKRFIWMVIGTASIGYVLFLSQVLKGRSFLIKLKKPLPGRRPNSPFIKRVIVLVSQPRSGSTFLSNFIAKTEKRLHFYEPFQALKKLKELASFKSETSPAYKATVSSILRQMINCQFSKKLESVYEKIYQGFFSQSSVNLCRKITTENANLCSGFKHEIFTHICRQYKALFVKVLEPRLPLHPPEVLNLMSNLNFRMIYLIRDPRASFWSLLNKGWVSSRFDGEFRKYIELRCQEMDFNLKMIQSMKMEKERKTIIILRHEDTLKEPLRMVTILSKFLEQEIPDNAINDLFARLRTTSRCEQDRSYSKDGSLPNWLKDAGEEFIKTVEENCETAMRLVGYKLRKEVTRNVTCDKDFVNDSNDLLNYFSDPYDGDVF